MTRTKTPWNKGLTKETSKIVARLATAKIGRKRLDMIGDRNPAKRADVRTKIRQAQKGKSYWNKGLISKHKDYKALMCHRRRARKLGNGGSHTLGEWENLKAQYNWTCPRCKKSEPEIKLTQDHIVPISKGGSDNIENIQPLCLRCNISKGTKLLDPYASS